AKAAPTNASANWLGSDRASTTAEAEPAALNEFCEIATAVASRSAPNRRVTKEVDVPVTVWATVLLLVSHGPVAAYVAVMVSLVPAGSELVVNVAVDVCMPAHGPVPMASPLRTPVPSVADEDVKVTLPPGAAPEAAHTLAV